jgi:glycosyltransferase involved in cell wall biosynthesis
MKPVFSVVVPIYKVEKYLEKCIESIINQTFTDFELLLVDDGSLDNCPAICDSYAQKDSRIRVIHKTNGGLVSARNTGIKEAKGEYICYVDGDDWIHLDLLKNVYENAISKYAPDMVIYGIVKKFRDHDEEIVNDLENGIYYKDDLKKLVYPYMMYDNRKPFCKGLIFPAACNKIYRTELLLNHYCTEEKIRMGEDNAFVYECVYYANSIYVYNEIMYYYDQHEGAMNHSYDANRFRNNKLLTGYITEKLGEKNSVLDSQINAFRAYWLTMAVFHEVKLGNSLFAAAKHIKKEIEETETLKDISLDGLPKSAKIFISLLRAKLYFVTLVAAKLIQIKRDKR